MSESVITKRISVEKPWMKHYSEEVRNLPNPKMTAYRYMTESNKDRQGEVAINYYGNKIKHAELKKNIDATANAFAAVGVKKGDIVSFLSVATPETIYCIYALNKLGATANTIDPRMDIESIRRAVVESESKIFVVMNVVYEKIASIVDELKQDLIVTVSASQSLPFIKRVAMNLKVKANVPYSDKIIAYNTLLAKGKGTTAVEAPYVGDAVFSIPYTGGTTGFPGRASQASDSHIRRSSSAAGGRSADTPPRRWRWRWPRPPGWPRRSNRCDAPDDAGQRSGQTYHPGA